MCLGINRLVARLLAVAEARVNGTGRRRQGSSRPVRTGCVRRGSRGRRARCGARDIEGLIGRGVRYGSPSGEALGYEGRSVAVVGGANSAGQAALHLADHAAQVTMLVRGDSLDVGPSQVVQLVEAGDGRERLEGVAIKGPEGEQALPADALFVLIGAEPLTAGVQDWLRCDDRGYFMTGPDLLKSSDRSWWPLERDPLFLESSQPGLFVAGDVRHGSIKRVACAVGEGAMAASLVHSYLAALDGDTGPV